MPSASHSTGMRTVLFKKRPQAWRELLVAPSSPVALTNSRWCEVVHKRLEELLGLASPLGWEG
jgi:hypothetical protein